MEKKLPKRRSFPEKVATYARRSIVIWKKKKILGYVYVILSLESLKIVFVKGPVWGLSDRVLSGLLSDMVSCTVLIDRVLSRVFSDRILSRVLNDRVFFRSSVIGSSLVSGSSDPRVLSRVLSPLFPVCLLERDVWITAEEHLLLKVARISFHRRGSAFFQQYFI